MGPFEMDPIIIVGSGLGGLALAQGLHKSSTPFKICERDQLHNVRTQGYRIPLHGEGLCALRSVLTDKSWDLFEDICPEIILGPLPNINTVTCEVTTANCGGNKPQGIIAHFADNTSESGSLLVGADGVRSAVRRQYLPHLRILDTKSRPMYGKTPLTPFFQSQILPKAMECLSLIKDPQTGSVALMEAIRFLPKDQGKDKRDLPNDYVYWVIIPPASSSPVTDKQLNHISKEGAAVLAKVLTAHWHPSLRPLIECQDPNQTGVFRLLSSDPEDLKRAWEPSAKFTLLGDAAHAMMPSTASGAVTALRDAKLLSGLVREQGVAKESIAKYEEDMRKYASEAVTLSAKIGQMSFGLRALADSEAVSV